MQELVTRLRAHERLSALIDNWEHLNRICATPQCPGCHARAERIKNGRALLADLEQAADALEQQAAEQAECESGCGPATPWRQEATALRDALERIRTILVNDGRGWQNTSALTDIEKVVDAALEGR